LGQRKLEMYFMTGYCLLCQNLIQH
jgi:hypothetical protein